MAGIAGIIRILSVHMDDCHPNWTYRLTKRIHVLISYLPENGRVMQGYSQPPEDRVQIRRP